VTSETVIAKGKSFEIRQSQLNKVMVAITNYAIHDKRMITPEKLLLVERKMLPVLIKQQLLLEIATDADKAEGKSKGDMQFSNLMERAGSQESLERACKSLGYTPEEMHSKTTQAAITTATLTRELAVAVTDVEAKKFYDNHAASFQDLKIPELTSGIKPEYESVEAKIKDYLLEQKLEKLAPAFYAKLEKDADVQILRSDLK
jgi:hypothetical protein